MWRKILIINLILVLGLYPVAQAVGPLVAPADTPAHEHHSMIMDCGQLDPGHCIDFDSCVSGSHASCDASAKATPSSPKTAGQPISQAYAPRPPERFLSHHPELLLRPPRNA